MKSKGYGALKRTIIISTLSFSLIPLLVLGLTIHYQFRTVYTQKVRDNLNTLVENKRRTIDLFLDERIAQISTLAYTHTFEELRDPTRLESIFATMQNRSRFYIDLGIIDSDGNHVSYAGPYKLQGINYRNEQWFDRTVSKGVFVSDVFLGFRKFPHFILSVLRREGNSFWIMRVTIDSDVFESVVKGAQFGGQSDAFILNGQGILQTSSLKGQPVLGSMDSPQFRGPKFSGSRVEAMNLDGTEGLYGMAWLSNPEWLLVLREDPRVDLLPLTRSEHLALGVAIAGILLIFAGTVFLARLMVGQLIKADREKESLDASLVQSSKMAALGKLAAGVAHEINNPLAIIKEKAGWMRDLLSEEDVKASPNFSEFKESVDKIDYHVERAKTVTHRLLGFARRMEPVQEQVDVNDTLLQTIAFLKTEAAFRNIQIRTEFQDDLPRITSDMSQLQQVFLNILDNGLDAVEKDGTIDVRTRYLQDTDELEVTMSDSGTGIPKDKLARIFDPFFTTKKPGEGTGLGLSISYSIIEKLGGRLGVTSEEGHGATFIIHLPVR